MYMYMYMHMCIYIYTHVYVYAYVYVYVMIVPGGHPSPTSPLWYPLIWSSPLPPFGTALSSRAEWSGGLIERTALNHKNLGLGNHQ